MPACPWAGGSEVSIQANATKRLPKPHSPFTAPSNFHSFAAMDAMRQIAKLECEVISIPIAGRAVRLWRPLRPESFILTTAEEEFGEDERLPYWAMLWPASIGLAEHLAELPGLSGRSVLELGAGLALPGLTAAREGAVVVVTDWYMDALEYAEASAQENGVTLHCKFLDWRHPPKMARFDYIVGADLLYERRNFIAILDALEQLLAPGGQAILSDPERHNSPAFIAMAHDKGWDCAQHRRRLEWEGAEFDVDCWVMRRP
jgi:predicted nicotinamide N-methyase